MSIVGIGIDVVDVPRFETVMGRRPRIVGRLFTEGEQRNARMKPERLAARFAAKEAVSKCFTTGIGAEFGWKSASVYHGSRHEPLVRLDEQGQALLAHVGATHVLLTLSHTESYAMAVAALVRA